MIEPPAKFAHGDYTVGWICALPATELVAAMALLDERHPGLPATDPHDANSYVLGRIGDHNVVIACLPAAITGKVSAATVAKDMIRSFPAVRFGLMVGIGGGAPYYGAKGNDHYAGSEDEEEDSEDSEDSEDDLEDIRDIRLGDVVISLPSKSSDAVVQYDFGKSLQGKEFIRTGGKLNKPPNIVLSTVSQLQAQHKLDGHNKISEILSESVSKYPVHAANFQYPVSKEDRLFKSTIVHDEGKSCKSCCGHQNCNLVQRKDRPYKSPHLHYGTIGSADQVMKDAILRDKWAREESIICFEMEAAGLMDSFPCLVIRGICDYADSHKNKFWQPYAAATAASYAKELLLVISGLGVKRMDPIKQIEESLRKISDAINDTSVSIQGLKDDKIFAMLPYAEGSSFDAFDAEHDTCHPETRVDLLHHIKEWACNPRQKCIFWLNGMAGTGKSTISRTMAQYFKKEGQLGASFFFKREERDRGTAKKFFTTICAQLLLHIPALIPHVEMAIDKDPYISGKLMKEQFDKLVLQPLLSLKRSESTVVVIVIDALDECEDKDDIRGILQLLPQVQKCKCMYIRIFLTSRPELPIRPVLEENNNHHGLVLHELSKTVVEKDIRVFLKAKFSEIKKVRKIAGEWPGDDTLETLVMRAVPLFISAATICRFVGDEKWRPESRLLTILQDPAATSGSQMDRTYLPVLNQLLSGANDREAKQLKQEFQNIIGVIILLATPLSVNDLAQLIDLPKIDISNRLDGFHSVLSVPEHIHSPIRILHLSFQEYLLTTESFFHIDEKETHRKIALHCLRVMNTSLKHNICGLPNYGTQRDDIDSRAINENLSADLQYACQYWVYHLDRSEARIVESLAFDFLKKHFLHWLEALSLMGVISMAVAVIDILQSGAGDLDVEFSNFLYDAKRFILKNISIAIFAPLQLYCSGLVFSPMRSTIRKIFLDSRPKEIHVLPHMEDYWSSELQTLEGHSGSVHSVALSPNGEILASGSNDNTIKLWDAKTGSELQTLEGHSGSVHSVAFSPNGEILASGSNDNTIKLWDAKTGSELQTLKGHSGSVHSVAFSPNGEMIASGSYNTSGSHNNTIKLWDIKTGSELQILTSHLGLVCSVAFSSDGEMIVLGSDDNTIKLWDAKTGSKLQMLEGHSDLIYSVAFSPNGRMVISGSYDSTIKLWDAKTGSELQTLEGHSGSVRPKAFSPDGKIVASGSNDNTIKLWDAKTGSELQTSKGHSREVCAVAFSPNGKIVASGSYDNTIKLWDAKTSAELQTLKSHSGLIYSVAFSHNSEIVASGSYDNTIKLWDATTGSELQTLKGHSGSVRSVAFSPNGKIVASGSNDNTIKFWDAKTGSELQTLKGHTREVHLVAFSPDGEIVASGSYDNTIKLWDATLGSELHTLRGYLRDVFSVAFSPDGEMVVASGSNGKTIKQWDVKAGSELQILKSHLDCVYSVASTLHTEEHTTTKPTSIPKRHDSSDPTSHHFNFQVSLSDDWVALAGENILWLPLEHRQVIALAVQEGNLALGYSDGRVSIIGFHKL